MMPRLLRSVLLLALSALPAAAQESPLRAVLLDRVAAIVGDRPILLTELYEALNTKIARREPIPQDTTEALRATLTELVDAELLVQQAKRFGITIADADITDEVDRTIARQRQDMSDREYVAALREAGLGSPEEYRRKRLEELRRVKMQQQAVDSLREKGRLPAINVSEAEVRATFDSLKASFPRTGPAVAFRQLIITPKPRAESEARARALADSLRARVLAGDSLEVLARRFSADSGSGRQGGDLGWARRGVYVAEFENYAFQLTPGVLSPVFRTMFGFHFLRVEQRRPSEVRVRHLLIIPERDSLDFVRTRAIGDGIVAAWRAGASYDSLVAAHHDPLEDRILAEPMVLDSLPASYRAALAPLAVNAVSEPFALPDPSGSVAKVAIVQVLSRSETGEPQFSQWQARIRSSLQQERSYRRLLDQLRRETFVEIKL